MNLNLDTIPYDQIGANDILLIRAENGGDNPVVQDLRKRLGEKAHILVLSPSTELCCIPESVFNGIGWVRK